MSPQPLTEMQRNIRQVFMDCQKSTATHRKLANNLYGVLQKCSTIQEEHTFIRTFIKCTDYILPVKRGERKADTVVRFVIHFIRYAQEKGWQIFVALYAFLLKSQ